MKRPTEEKQLTGTLSISRTSSNRPLDRPIKITLEDELSRCRVVQIELTLADFAEALTGMFGVPCQFTWPSSSVVGKRHEHKTEVVFIPDKCTDRKDQESARKHFAEFEVDGWRGRVSDAFNSHRWAKDERPNPCGVRGMWTSITFDRWVEAESAEESDHA